MGGGERRWLLWEQSGRGDLEGNDLIEFAPSSLSPTSPGICNFGLKPRAGRQHILSPQSTAVRPGTTYTSSRNVGLPKGKCSVLLGLHFLCPCKGGGGGGLGVRV